MSTSTLLYYYSTYQWSHTWSIREITIYILYVILNNVPLPSVVSTNGLISNTVMSLSNNILYKPNICSAAYKYIQYINMYMYYI